MPEPVTVLDVERCDIANLSSLVILLVGVEKLPIVNPLGELGLKPVIEARCDIGRCMTVELLLGRPESPRVGGRRCRSPMASRLIMPSVTSGFSVQTAIN